MIRLQFNENSSNSLAQQIFAFLDEQGGYTDYNQKIEDVAETFGLSEKEAESFVWDWSTGLYNNDIDEDYLAETSDWRTNPNRLNDVEDVFVNDVFVDNKGNKVKIVKVNKDDFTVVNLDTDIVSKIRKDYLITHFELIDDFWECVTSKTLRQKRSVNEGYNENEEISNLVFDIETTGDHRLIDKAYDFINKYCDNIDDIYPGEDYYAFKNASWAISEDKVIKYLTDLLFTYNESLTEKISDQDYSQSKKGVAYKVFRIKNGKLYPPMVANPGGGDTPVGVWLDAEEGEFAGLSKTGRKQVKSTGSGNLAYRPGWHLGDEPRAKQFDREASWEMLEELPEGEKISGTVQTVNTLAKKATPSNIGKYFYVKSTNQYAHIFGGNGEVFFPYDFIWAECEYVMDINYQSEADEQGYMRTREDGSTYRSDKYQHSLAGLPKLPTKGYYKYRTNPNPDTVPWVITGAIKVTKLLDDFDVRRILGNNAPERQGGDKTLAELGLKQI